MRQIVGLTLGPSEQEALTEGYDLRDQIAARLCAIDLTPPDARAQNGLEMLVWTIAQGHLDVKVAIPVGSSGIYHGKVGIITDVSGFDLFWDPASNPKMVRVYEFPEAARQKLLEFLPKEDRESTSPFLKRSAPPPEDHNLLPDEYRRTVWTFNRRSGAALKRLSNGLRAGETTSPVTPWQHQTHTFHPGVAVPVTDRGRGGAGEDGIGGTDPAAGNAGGAVETDADSDAERRADPVAERTLREGQSVHADLRRRFALLKAVAS